MNRLQNRLLNPTTVIDGEAIDVNNLLVVPHLVPSYQRDYVWKDQQVMQLWSDFIDYHKRLITDGTLTNPTGYFLGAMVVINDPPGTADQVVDGQQRLTTLSTVIVAVADELRKLPPGARAHDLAGTLSNLLGTFDGQNYSANLQFHDQELNDFFLENCVKCKSMPAREQLWTDQKWVEKLKKKNSSLARLRTAISIGSDQIKSFLAPLDGDPEKRSEALVDFTRTLIFSVVLLKIKATSFDSAWEIFESLNNRNVPLSQSDLVKNLILRLGTSANQQAIVSHWENARDYLQDNDQIEIDLKDLLHYSALSRFSAIKAKSLYSTIKARVTSAQLATTYARDLEDDAKAFDALTNNFSAGWTHVTCEMLNDLSGTLKTKLIYPYLMAVYRRHHADPAEMEAHVRLGLNFAFRFISVGDGSIEEFARHVSSAALMVNTKTSIEIAAFFKAQASDTKFIEDFKRFSANNAKMGYFCCYYIEKLRLSGTTPIQHGNHKQDLEHVMPKAPKAQHWALAKAQKDADEDTFKQMLWRIGNLLPLPATNNRSIGNKDIQTKITSYAQTHLVSPLDISIFMVGADWSFASIEKRQEFLANKFAVAAWSF
jgi:hypothetical protein